MNLLRTSCFAAVAVLASVAACVGSDPLIPDEVGDAGSQPDVITSLPPVGDATTDAPLPCEQGIRCGDTCVDTTSSADNCGSCGHSCGGGTCTMKACDPIVVANGVAAPLGVAAAGGSAFWLRNGAVERCPVTGCTGAPFVVTDQVVTSAGQPGGTTIVTDGNQVGWIANGNASGNGRDVFSCGVAGCLNGFPPVHSTGMTDAPTQIALSGSTIFATQNTGAERQGPLATLALTGAGLGSDVPTGIAADANYLYCAGVAQSAYGVDRCTRSGSTCTSPQRLFVGATYLAAGGGSVFATSTDGIKKCDGAMGCGGVAAIVAPDDKAASAIAATDTVLAWSNGGSTSTSDGTVRVCSLPACASPRTVATGQAHPVSVAIDGGFVYWANNGVVGTMGSIWRAAL